MIILGLSPGFFFLLKDVGFVFGRAVENCQYAAQITGRKDGCEVI